MKEKKFVCPCCGYSGLDVPPYANICERGIVGAKPPYESQLGRASYDVCSCCEYEYGFDDNPGDGMEGTSFGDHLHEWIANGMIWAHPKDMPKDFNLIVQLSRIGKEYYKQGDFPVSTYLVNK